MLYEKKNILKNILTITKLQIKLHSSFFYKISIEII